MVDRGSVWRLLRGSAEIGGYLTGSETGGFRKILASDFVDFHREREFLELAQCRREFVDGVIGTGDGAVASRVGSFELIVGVYFFTRLKAGEDTFASQALELAAIQIDAVFRVNPIFVFFQQPIDAVG